MTEEQLQAQCYEWFWNTHISHRRMLLHVDNNSSDRNTGNKKRALGVVKGVSDFILIVHDAVFFVELKIEKGSQSYEQIDFEKKVLQRGHIYTIIRSFESFKELINKILL